MSQRSDANILFVDGNESATTRMAAILEDTQEQFTVETATEMDGALDLMSEKVFECVVATNDLEEQSGLALLEAVRETSPTMPFVLYPREGSEKLASEAIRAGVSGYVPRSSETDHETVLAAQVKQAITDSGPTDQEQSHFERDITKIAIDLLQTTTQDFADTIESTLQTIGMLTEADRAFVYRIRGEDTVEKTHEWCNEQIDSGLAIGKSVPKYKMSWWIDQLQSFEPVVISSVSDLPPEASIEQGLLEEHTIASLVTAPMIREDKLIGFVGLDRTEPKGGWSEDEKDLLMATGELINSVLQREARLRELERREAYLEHSNDIISVLNADGSIQFQSESTEGVTDFSPADVMGQSGFDHVHPDDQERVLQTFGPFVAEPGASVTEELRVKAKDGGWRWIEVSGINKLNDPLIDGLLFSSQDITEQKDRKRSHRRLEERLELAVDGAGLGVWDWDMTTDEVAFNERWAQMLGYSPDEMEPLLDAWEKLVHPKDIDNFEAALEAHIAGDKAYFDTKHRMRTGDGDWKWVRGVGKIFERNEDGDPIRAAGIHLDIDERMAYESELKRTRATLRQVIDLAPGLIFAKNKAGEYLLANEQMASVFGMTPDALEGKVEAEVIPAVENSEQFRQDHQEVIDSGEQVYVPEEELTTVNGETRILETIKLPFLMPESEEKAVLGYSRDITELKESEQQLESQRDVLAELNQVLRHDIRDRLQLVLDSKEMVRSNQDLPAERTIERVLSATREAVEITDVARGVADFKDDSTVTPKSVEIRPVLAGEVEDIHKKFDDVTVSLEGSIPDERVLADDMLEPVFHILLRNAIRQNDKDPPLVTVSATGQSGEVSVRITDNGPGISDAKKEAMFEEGTTTLESEDTGRGLFIVKTLVDRYGGTLTVEDAEPTGAVFVLQLPIA